jgi:hypothetical protein
MVVHLYIMQIVRLLLTFRSSLFHGEVDISAKNSRGLTAFDMLQGDNQQIIEDMLRRAGSFSIFQRPSIVASDADYLKSPVQTDEKILIAFFRLRTDITDDTRNMLLVVAALLVTVFFQATISPPGGVWQDNSAPTTNTSDRIAPATNASSEYSQAPHVVGTAILNDPLFSAVTSFTVVSFSATVFTIFVLLPSSLISGFFIILLFILFLLFVMVLFITSPRKTNLHDPWPLALMPFVSLLFFTIFVALLDIMFGRRRKHLVGISIH